MKVLHINTTDKVGGAAIACWRLHEALLANEVDSRLLVGSSKLTNKRVAKLPSLSWNEAQLFKFTQYLGLNDIHRQTSLNIIGNNFFKESEILHLHNLHPGYFNYLSLPRLTQDKPAILTLHDLWPITGHCAFSGECTRWQTGCGKCPDLNTYPAVKRDGTSIEWHLKKWTYARSNISAVVATSRWSENILKKSILSSIPIHYIPLGIDTDIYEPLKVEYCRNLLKIPQKKKIILFSAQNITDYRKGGDLLVQALKNLSVNLKEELILLTMGSGGSTIAEAIDIPVENLGFIESDRMKAIAYSSADIFVCPSREETFGMTSLEALACGTPVISFKVGGMPDLIDTGLNGYLIEKLEPGELSKGIAWLLNAPNLHDMGKAARRTTLEKGQLSMQVQRYKALYEQILDQN